MSGENPWSLTLNDCPGIHVAVTRAFYCMPMSLLHLSTSFHLFTGLKKNLINYHSHEIDFKLQQRHTFCLFHKPCPTEVVLIMFRQIIS